MALMRVMIAGAAGRMGRMLVRAIHEEGGVHLVGALGRPDSLSIGQDAGLLAGVGRLNVPIVADPAPLLAKADGIIDFTTPETTLDLLSHNLTRRLPHVIGTTGFSQEALGKLEEASTHIPLLHSGNMSLGVHLLAAITQKIAKSLGVQWDVEIVEMHHRNKIDAPSGTALLLGEAAAKGRSVSLPSHQILSREHRREERAEGHIGFASLRGGTVVGDHTVIFAGEGERLELTHRAENRQIFARGAIEAMRWLEGKPPGLYHMADVLGIEA